MTISRMLRVCATYVIWRKKVFYIQSLPTKIHFHSPCRRLWATHKTHSNFLTLPFSLSLSHINSVQTTKYWNKNCYSFSIHFALRFTPQTHTRACTHNAQRTTHHMNMRIFQRRERERERTGHTASESSSSSSSLSTMEKLSFFCHNFFLPRLLPLIGILRFGPIDIKIHIEFQLSTTFWRGLRHAHTGEHINWLLLLSKRKSILYFLE